MVVDYEALQHAQRALSIFDGISDSFGGQMYSDVVSGMDIGFSVESFSEYSTGSDFHHGH